MKSAACDISANWKIMTSATGSPSGRATAALRVVWPAPSIRGDACGKDRVWQTHTLDLFRHATPVSGRSFHCSESLIAVNYAGRKLCGAVTRSRARSHDRRPANARHGCCCSSARTSRACRWKSSDQSRACGVCKRRCAHGSPASCRIGSATRWACAGLHRRRSARAAGSALIDVRMRWAGL